MPRRAKPKMYAPSKYAMVYTIFLILELIYVFLLWSPYGKPDGMFHDMYQRIRNNLNLFVAFSMIYIVVYSFIFPGIGLLAFIITLWRVADLCCKRKTLATDYIMVGVGITRIVQLFSIKPIWKENRMEPEQLIAVR